MLFKVGDLVKFKPTAYVGTINFSRDDGSIINLRCDQINGHIGEIVKLGVVSGSGGVVRLIYQNASRFFADFKVKLDPL